MPTHLARERSLSLPGHRFSSTAPQGRINDVTWVSNQAVEVLLIPLSAIPKMH